MSDFQALPDVCLDPRDAENYGWWGHEDAVLPDAPGVAPVKELDA